MKISWIVLVVSFITMLLGTCWIEQIAIERESLSIRNLTYWGAKCSSRKIIPLREIKMVDVQLSASHMHKGGTPYAVGVRTDRERILLTSYIFNSEEKARKAKSNIEDGIKTGGFYSSQMPNIVCVYASLIGLVLWFLFDRKIFQ